MATQDISRSAFDRRKHYRGVQMQQGRVVVDDDWNDREAIDDEDTRRDLLSIVGPQGTADDGFRIVERPAAAGLDFDIRKGTFYVGGLRAELEADERYGLQHDWLDQDASERAAPAADRYDLAYLEVWEQPVTAAEDAELFEVALGGADTSTRVRTMARVRLATDVQTDDCHKAWKVARDRFKQQGRGTLNAENELVRDVSLKVDFATGGNAQDLCTPLAQGGYLGAENQAIRVQLTDQAKLTWGFDNASRLYRVNLAAGATRKTVTLQSDPKDPTHWPLKDQAVELLPWVAVLPNGEKVAAWSGHVDTVATSYDPDSRTLTLTNGVAATWGRNWASRSDQAQLGAEFFYLRVWDRGADRSGGQVTIQPALPLGNTGLKVTLTGTERLVGDHWVIAARPETPRRVVPWQLEAGLQTRGPRLFVAPLALVRWQNAGGGLTQGTVVHDCRWTFKPLTRLRGCCTCTVGDGEQSHGDFETIQAAVDSLPSSGGEVCVLPGEYVENVEIAGRAHVTVRGCGRRSLLRAPAGTARPAVAVLDSLAVTLKSFAIESLERPAVLVAQTPGKGTGAGPALRTTLAELTIVARDRGAIRAEADWIDVRGCRIAARKLAASLADGADAGRWPSVLLTGDDVRFEGNVVLAGSDKGASTAPLGGVQVGGGSERVELRRNVIAGGNGNGVTLGSLLWVIEDEVDDAEADWAGFREKADEKPQGIEIMIGERGCVEIGGETPEVTNRDGKTLVPVSAGALSDVLIADNEIRAMGGNGVSVAHFFDLDRRPDMITVDRCTLERNRIHDCLRLEIGATPEAMRAVVAHGGVALAAGEYPVIRDNEIEHNGTSHVDPICGIFLLEAEGAAIERNRVVENGPRADTGAQPAAGQRGGIVVLLATTQPLPGPSDDDRESGRGEAAVAARVHDNVVVAPEGRALKLGAIGPLSISGNELVTRGASGPGILAAIAALLKSESRGAGAFRLMELPLGATVFVLDLGTSSELYGGFAGSTKMALSSPGVLATPFLPLLGYVPVLAQGNVLFGHNQVTLDLITEAGTEAESSALSSVLIATLDDVGFHGNQCECHVQSDQLLANAIVGGWSVRLSDNRFKEPFNSMVGREISLAGFPLGKAGTEGLDEIADDSGVAGRGLGARPPGGTSRLSATAIGLFWPRYSAITLGLMNATTDNQGTNCFLSLGPAKLAIRRPNTSLVDLAGKSVCKLMQRYGEFWFRQLLSYLGKG
jgi:hypothetical protein